MRAFLAVVATFAFSAQAQKADDRTLVYVDDVAPADKSLAADASALTTALCAALSKDKRLDVLCAPDVKQILNFAATAAMVGTQGGASSAVTDRLDRTKQVVSSSFRKEGGQYVLTVKAGPKAADATATGLYTDKPSVALEERGDAQKKILDKLPSLTTRIVDTMFKPAAAAPKPAPTPAPLEKTGGGW